MLTSGYLVKTDASTDRINVDELLRRPLRAAITEWVGNSDETWLRTHVWLADGSEAVIEWSADQFHVAHAHLSPRFNSATRVYTSIAYIYGQEA